MRRVSRIAFVSTFVGLMGCSLVADLDGLHGLAPDTARLEEPRGDAGLDVGDPGDGGGVGKDEAGAPDGARPRCVPAEHAVCADFDDGTLGSTWTRVTGDVTLDSTTSTSAPNCAVATVLPGASDGSTLMKVVDATSPRALSCEFSLLRRFTGAEPSMYFMMGVGGSDTSVPAELGLSTSSSRQILSVMTDEARAVEHDLGPALPASSWARVGVRLDLEANMVEVQFNGGPTRSFPLGAFDASSANLVVFGFGADHSESSAVIFAFDDIVCDVAEG